MRESPHMDDLERNKLFVQLFTQHARRIFSYITTLMGNHEDAEEVFQETSMTLWEKFSEFQPNSNFSAWAHRVAFFKAKSRSAKKRHSPVIFSDEVMALVDQEVVAAGDLLDAHFQALADCYAKLPERDRELIDRRYQAGAKVADIAKSLKKPTLTIYRWLAKIHEELFKCVSRAVGEASERDPDAGGHSL